MIYVSSRTFDAMIYDTSSKFRLGTKVGHFNRLVSWTFLGQSKGNNGYAKMLRVIFGKFPLSCQEILVFFSERQTLFLMHKGALYIIYV